MCTYIFLVASANITDCACDFGSTSESKDEITTPESRVGAATSVLPESKSDHNNISSGRRFVMSEQKENDVVKKEAYLLPSGLSVEGSETELEPTSC
jgi:hypothetical protein